MAQRFWFAWSAQNAGQKSGHYATREEAHIWAHNHLVEQPKTQQVYICEAVAVAVRESPPVAVHELELRKQDNPEHGKPSQHMSDNHADFNGHIVDF